jgi:GDP-D-mannose dehydratase
VSRIIREFDVDTVIHFAGSIAVPESIERPIDYYENNTMVSCELVAACLETGVNQFIFSSTAAVYGSTNMVQVSETAPTQPVNPYGRSKLMVEWMLEDAGRAHGFRYVALRYFNVAGVEPGKGAGQPERQIPHLIKRVAQVALGHAECLEVFGTVSTIAATERVRAFWKSSPRSSGCSAAHCLSGPLRAVMAIPPMLSPIPRAFVQAWGGNPDTKTWMGSWNRP